MSVYKYMPARWGLDFLATGRLKLTPPAEFNDPFELQPPVPELFGEEHLLGEFDASVQGIVLDELAKAIGTALGLPVEASRVMAEAFRDGPDSEGYKALVDGLRIYPGFSERDFRAATTSTRDMLPQLIENARRELRAARPSVNAIAARGIRHTLAGKLGVLCLSKNSNQPLMWSHYASGHTGLLIELDNSHPSLNRRPTAVGELGFLRPVQYTSVRPKLDMSVVDEDRGFDVFALTKSEHWAYEEELRLVWPLERCEVAPDGKTRLFDVPASAVRTITIGCKASGETEATLLEMVSTATDLSHIKVRRARLHDMDFELVYEDVAAQPGA